MIPQNRAADKGVFCWIAARMSDAWDWIDGREVDKHLACWASFYMTYFLLNWTLNFVWVYPDKPGLEVAAIVGAVWAPWTPVQGFIIKWYLEARTKETK